MQRNNSLNCNNNFFLKQDNVYDLNHKNNVNRVDIDYVDVKLKLFIKMSSYKLYVRGATFCF